MRVLALVLAAFILSMSGSTFAQEWKEYVSKQDLLQRELPG